MIKLGDIIDIFIEKMSFGGEGLSRFGDEKFVIFTKGAVAGDKLKVKITALNKKHAKAEIVEIIEPSKYRTNPFCPLFNACGSCELQNYDYNYLLIQKHIVLKDIFHDILDEKNIYPIIKSPETKGYRHKIQYSAKERKNSKKILLGYYKKNSHELVNIKYCPIQKGIGDLISQFIRDNFPFDCYSEKTGKGLLKNVLMRINSHSLEILLTLVLNIKKEEFINYKKEISAFFDKISLEFEEIKGCFINFNPNKTNSILGNDTIKVSGEDYIIETLGDKKYKLGAASFFQINPKAAILLFDVAKENIKANSTILDAYGGVGAIGIWASDKASKITLIEENENAVLMAGENFKINNIKNYEILKGDAKKHFHTLKNEKRIFDYAILDPPRSGCDREAIDDISQIANNIIYISCNPQTQKRDVNFLIEHGFKIKFIQGVDLFPYTYHIESVCLLEKEK